MNEMYRQLLCYSLFHRTEDVDVKIKNLKKDESVVQKAGEYVSELKFLISEIDKKKEDIR